MLNIRKCHQNKKKTSVLAGKTILALKKLKKSVSEYGSYGHNRGF